MLLLCRKVVPAHDDHGGVCFLARSVIEHLINPATPLAVTGHDILTALEVSTAAYHSALAGGVPVPIPLAKRTGTEPGSPAIYPRGYRWGGGDFVGSIQVRQQNQALS